MNKKNLFFKRVCAFLIDIIIVYVISQLVSSFLPVFGDISGYTEELNNILTAIQTGSEDIESLMMISNDITYKVLKATYLTQISSIVIYLLYFVVYQKNKNGQTLGKKIMKIKVQKTNNTTLNYDDLLKRGTILYGYLANIINLMILLFFSKDLYINITGYISTIQGILFLTNAFTLIAGTSIHDKFAKTIVVEEN